MSALGQIALRIGRAQSRQAKRQSGRLLAWAKSQISRECEWFDNAGSLSSFRLAGSGFGISRGKAAPYWALTICGMHRQAGRSYRFRDRLTALRAIDEIRECGEFDARAACMRGELC